MEGELLGSCSFDAASLPEALVQVLGGHLSPAELRNARLACKPWATALAVCMPSMTVSLPQQAPDNVFRQPLVLCSSGQLNSASSVNYSATPLPRMPAPSMTSQATVAAAASALARHGSCSVKPRPSPFATRGGQAAMSHNPDEISPGPLPPSPFIHAASIQPGSFTQMDHREHAPSSSIAAAAAAAAAAAWQQALQWQSSGMIQSWSSLPAAGLKTCSSLQQLHLQLSGAPPTPQDLVDLSTLAHLTHLSFRQVDGPAPLCEMPSWQLPSRDKEEEEAAAAAAAFGIPQDVLLAPPGTAAAAGAGDAGNISYDGGCRPCVGCSGTAQRQQSMSFANFAGFGAAAAAALGQVDCNSVASSISGGGTPYASAVVGSRSTSCSSLDDLIGVADSVGSLSSSYEPTCSGWRSAAAGSADDRRANGNSNSISMDDSMEADSDDTVQPSDQLQPAAAAAPQHAGAESGSSAFGFALCGLAAPPSHHTERISCSVITPEHVAALAKLPHLSSLELYPKLGSWDAAATAALVQLTALSGLTRLSLTWGNIDDAAGALGHMPDAEAVHQAHGVQLPLQQCLLELGPQLHELELHGRAVVDVVVLQRMQKLRKLWAEALRVVNSDVVLQLEQQQQQQPPVGAAAAAAAGGGAGAGAGAGGIAGQQAPPAAQPDQQPDQQQQPQRRSPKWATLPLLESLRVVHPASDVSVLLQGTQTPHVSELGFVTRSPSDFARLLGQHGKLKVLHLVFPDDEPWHPIAVVRLPTALPSLRSLTLEGKFWLPNSLIVALGVMEVPLEELKLTCKLAPPCLERLQHLKELKRLELHHVAWVGHPADGLVTKDVMLQLPAKLLPPGLTHLEISNGWILH